MALSQESAPSILALTRQSIPLLRIKFTANNLCSRGAYILKPAKGKQRVTILATGSEVHIAIQARDMLQSKGIGTAVVSMPSWKLFEQQSTAYKKKVLGPDTLRIAVEAGVREGWDRYIGPDGEFIGMATFGESAPYQDLYQYFKITPEAIVKVVNKRLQTERH